MWDFFLWKSSAKGEIERREAIDCLPGVLTMAKNLYESGSTDSGARCTPYCAIELSADLSSPIGEPTCCVKLSQASEAGPNARARCNEGTFVIKHNGLYYMTYSANHYADVKQRRISLMRP